MAMPITRVISKCLLPVSVLTSSPSAQVSRTYLKQHSPDDFPSQTVSVVALRFPFMVKTEGFPRYVDNQKLLIGTKKITWDQLESTVSILLGVGDAII